MSKTEDTEESTGRGVGELFLVLLVAGLVLAHLDVGFDHVLGDGCGDSGAECAGLSDVLANFMGSEDDAVGVRVAVVHVDEGYVAGEESIGITGWSIEDEEKNVETGEEGCGKVDVLYWRDAWVVAAVQRIGSCED